MAAKRFLAYPTDVDPGSGDTDWQAFALWYCQQVRRRRPDVTIVDEEMRGFE